MPGVGFKFTTKIKSCTLNWLSQPGAPNFNLIPCGFQVVVVSFAKKIILSPLTGLGSFVKNSLDNGCMSCPSPLFPHYEHEMSFHLLGPPLISFNHVLQFAVDKYITCLVKSIPKYFILCDATVNGAVFLLFQIVHY